MTKQWELLFFFHFFFLLIFRVGCKTNASGVGNCDCVI